MDGLICWRTSTGRPRDALEFTTRLPDVEKQLATGTFAMLHAKMKEGRPILAIPNDRMLSKALTEYILDDTSPPAEEEMLVDLASAFFTDFDYSPRSLEISHLPALPLHCVVIPPSSTDFRVCDLYLEISEPDETGYQLMEFRIEPRSQQDSARALERSRLVIGSCSESESQSEDVSGFHSDLPDAGGC